MLRFLYDIRAVLVTVLFGILFGVVLVFPLNLFARFLPRAESGAPLLAVSVAFDVTVLLLGLPFANGRLRGSATTCQPQ